MASIIVLTLYTVLYITFTCLGLGFSQTIYRDRKNLILQLSPIFGLSTFCLISTELMYYSTGRMAGKIAFVITALLSFVLFLASRNFYTLNLKKLLNAQKIGFIAGLIFLLPLFIAGDYGIFALNGADFGSYAGWGQYFQDYSLRDAIPHTIPANFTLRAFTNLQRELTNAHGAWRVGNVSFYAALCSLFPSYWPTLYTVSIAFLIGQFAIAIQLFSRFVLLQTKKSALLLSVLTIFLNTVYWLAASHYVPNLFGLTFTLLLLSLLIMQKTFKLRMIIGNSIILGALWLIYPESIVFLPFIFLPQLFVRNSAISKRLFSKKLYAKIITLTLIFTVSAFFAFLWTYDAFFYCLRHLSGILGYDRPGDFVGIDMWSYASQGLGFADYNSVLKMYSGHWHRVLLKLNYAAAFIVLCFTMLLPHNTSRQKAQKYTLITLLFCILVLLIPIINYFRNYQYLVAWRSLITISPYVWLILSITFLNAIACWKSNYYRDRNIITSTYLNKCAFVTMCSFLLLFSSAILFRTVMIKNVAFGATHAAIFGQAYKNSIDQLKLHDKSYDIAFIDYEGSGTIQGGWEFYSQNLRYLFPQHGSGVNEYSIEPIVDKRVVIISDSYKKVHSLVGFDEKFYNYQNKHISFARDNNIFLPYSSTWIYLAQKNPQLLLPGLPGKFLLWLDKNTSACMKLKVNSDRDNAVLRITINSQKPVLKKVNGNADIEVCTKFKNDLNIIRFEPILLSQNIMSTQHDFVQKLKQQKKLTETEQAIYAIYSGEIQEVNPVVAPSSDSWNRKWNLVVPPDEFPLNPHILFNKIEITKTA